MDIRELIDDLAPRIAALRRDLHAHPELAFGEWRTADIVAAHLERLGIETHRGLAGTAVIGKLASGDSGRSIGLRADMDALPLEELNSFAHRSTHPGCMHACGHDGHTAMLLGAAEAMARGACRFDGCVYFIFQPAEEHAGGARVMVEQGLFDLFPIERVFGMHNWPGLPAGQMAVRAGPVMAGADQFNIVVTGRGGHAAMPDQAADPVVAAAALVQSLQTLVSRNTAPFEPAVLSVTRIHAGHADNVLPEQAVLGGTTRSFDPAQQALLEAGMRRICDGIAAAYGVSIELEYQRGYPPTANWQEEATLCREVARSVAGSDNVRTDMRPSMGAEDFAYLLRERPGCYVWLGNGMGEGGCLLHSPRYDFNDEVLGLGMRYWLALVERALAVRAGNAS